MMQKMELQDEQEVVNGDRGTMKAWAWAQMPNDEDDNLVPRT
jgi:hypothetical protein